MGLLCSTGLCRVLIITEPCARRARGFQLAKKTLGRDMRCVDIRMSMLAAPMRLSIYREDDAVKEQLLAFPTEALLQRIYRSVWKGPACNQVQEKP